jgi:hypothetical protein
VRRRERMHLVEGLIGISLRDGWSRDAGGGGIAGTRESDSAGRVPGKPASDARGARSPLPPRLGAGAVLGARLARRRGRARGRTAIKARQVVGELSPCVVRSLRTDRLPGLFAHASSG